jgi:D-alanine-D-alanine ligase-like ATP-grasp enzyme
MGIATPKLRENATIGAKAHLLFPMLCKIAATISSFHRAIYSVRRDIEKLVADMARRHRTAGLIFRHSTSSDSAQG